MTAVLDKTELATQFKKWQCLCRQTAMRENMGRPDGSMAPLIYLGDSGEPLMRLVTVFNKLPQYSETAELLHIARKTNDAAQIRENGLKHLSATYYQKADQFADILTATFPPDSKSAKDIRAAGQCRLIFEAYVQRYDLVAKTWTLAPNSPFHEATIAHNQLFNPQIPADMVVVGFEIDWEISSASRLV